MKKYKIIEPLVMYISDPHMRDEQLSQILHEGIIEMNDWQAEELIKMGIIEEVSESN